MTSFVVCPASHCSPSIQNLRGAQILPQPHPPPRPHHHCHLDKGLGLCDRDMAFTTAETSLFKVAPTAIVTFVGHQDG